MFKDVLFSLPGIALTVLCWGAYGSVLHKGQDGFKKVSVTKPAGQEGSKPDLVAIRLKPLICVGIAYFIVAIIVPCAVLASRGTLGGGWGFTGLGWSLTAGTAGALGALGIILALSSGGKPIFVMPLVFGCAPVVNVFVSMYFSGTSLRDQPGFRLAMFTSGIVLVSLGAVMVLIFQPKPPATALKPETRAAKESAEPEPKGRPEAEDVSGSSEDESDGPSDTSASGSSD
jgi:hypothetical protein